MVKDRNKKEGLIWFYVDGFKSMHVGKVLWAIILIKLFIMFFILKLFFFPNFLSSKSSNSDGKGKYVASELIERSTKP